MYICPECGPKWHIQRPDAYSDGLNRDMWECVECGFEWEQGSTFVYMPNWTTIYRTTVIALLLLILSGCASAPVSQGKPTLEVVHIPQIIVRFVPSQAELAAMAARMGCTDCDDVWGYTTPPKTPDDVCQIVTVKPTGYGGPATEVFGHEVRHCFEGNFHE